MKKNRKILVVIIFLILIILLPYAKTEILTIRYGEEFQGLENQTNMLTNSKYHKVFSYNDTKAKVFYVSDTGDMITFVKNNNNEWKIYEWKTIWSHSGSAEDFIWPYYR